MPLWHATKQTRGNVRQDIFTPRVCSGVSGNTPRFFSRRESARMSCPATTELFDANRWTQLTVGWLSLNSATWDPEWRSHTSSMMRYSSKRPAISKSEFVMRPCGLSSVTKSCLMSSGHSTRNTVGVHPLFSPMMIPPMPCFEASLMPTKSGHPATSSAHFVGARVDSQRRVLQSAIAVCRPLFLCR